MKGGRYYILNDCKDDQSQTWENKTKQLFEEKKMLLIMLTVDHHFSCLCFVGCKPHVFNRKGHDWEEGGGVGG